MTVGWFGGTFDPIHVGHLDVARAARRALALDHVRFVPSRLPPHRARPLASAAHRFAMVALAIAGEDGMLISDIEMDGTGPTYTIDTCARIAARDPSPSRPIFITGADAFLEIRTWRAWRELLDRCHFAVVSRPGVPASALRSALLELAPRMLDAPCALPSAPSILLIDATTTAVSSTDVRLALRSGAPPIGLVPEAVASYALKHDLYVNDHAREHEDE